jgi:signal transduction histidine kinase
MKLPPARVRLRLIFGVATVLGIFSTIQAYNYVQFFAARQPPLPILFGLNMTYWYTWAILAPAILWLGGRHQFGRHTWKKAAAVHFVGVIVAVFLHAVLAVACRMAIVTQLSPIIGFTPRPLTWSAAFQENFFLSFDWEMMTYWALVGFSHALNYHRESQEQRITAAQLEARLAEARLQSLQSQLHPHFLFNTLHTISALMHRDTEAADEMLARLSDLLRLSLDRLGTQQVTLKEEMDFVGKYLDIERTRFGDRLHVQVDVDAETLDAAVPNLILQPIVENALKHGIARQIGGGRVHIQTSREGDELRLVVRDTGPGLPAAKLTALNTGVGLRNTRSRLEELFPGRHRFEFHEPPDGGLAVEIRIPFIIHPDTHPDLEMENVA